MLTFFSVTSPPSCLRAIAPGFTPVPLRHISALAQFLICLALFIYRYISFARYMIQPLTVVLAYFATEGVVRFVAAFVTGEVVPTLPLAAAVWLHQRISDRRAEAAMGERVADLIESVDSPDIEAAHPLMPPETGLGQSNHSFLWR